MCVFSINSIMPIILIQFSSISKSKWKSNEIDADHEIEIDFDFAFKEQRIFRKFKIYDPRNCSAALLLSRWTLSPQECFHLLKLQCHLKSTPDVFGYKWRYKWICVFLQSKPIKREISKCLLLKIYFVLSFSTFYLHPCSKRYYLWTASLALPIYIEGPPFSR